MSSRSGSTWALVLAAGDGTRLHSLTTTAAGIAVPKQFCSLAGGQSLLQEALRRAECIANPEHICTIVSQQHERWWHTDLMDVPANNIIVQPENRGTANGILLPLLHIAQRDAHARIVLLPSDHHVRDEGLLSTALRDAVAALARRKREIILLGVEPEEPDCELGYILPANRRSTRLRSIERFVEKPPEPVARELVAAGALWNVFIVAARVRTLLDVFSELFPGTVAQMRRAIAEDAISPFSAASLRVLYRTLPVLDFSRDVAERCTSLLRVLTIPSCGWSDLGTPLRVARTLARSDVAVLASAGMPRFAGPVSLATQHRLSQ